MSDTQVGGNGSVHWLVNADEVGPGDPPQNGPQQGRRWRQRGVDYRGNPAGYASTFTVRIKVPQNDPEWLERLRKVEPVNGVIEFELEIEKRAARPATQIQICWGNKPAWSPTF